MIVTATFLPTIVSQLLRTIILKDFILKPALVMSNEQRSVFFDAFEDLKRCIRSLFTNVPLAETIQICADSLYGGELIPPDYPKEIFVELMNTATKLVEFCFNNNMYKQIDSVAMGSPLSVALANIFVGYHESKLFESTTKPFLYHRYVDDTLAIFRSEDECTSFLDALNSMHSALKFTFEKEENDRLPFLDVLVEKSNEGFLTSVFRKPTFTGQYFRWDSFGPTKRKTNLIETLVHRALMICSKRKLQHELENISSILRNNGYPESIIQIAMSKKIALFNRKPKEGPQKCPVYLKLPWIGKISLNFEKQTKIAINRCYQAVEPRIIFTTRKILPAIHKDVLPSLQKVWSYINACAAVTVGTWVKLPKDCKTKLINTFRDA